jgi:hypothetical protein
VVTPRRAGIVSTLAAAIALLVPAGVAPAAEQPGPVAGAAAGSPITVVVKGPGRVGLLDKLRVVGEIADSGPNENVFLTVRASGRRLFTKRLNPSSGGEFRMPLLVNSCCRYSVIAEHDGRSAADGFSVRVPKSLGKGARTRLFHRLLRREGYHIAGISRRVNWSTRLAILAFRKVNGMARRTGYRPSIFRKLLQGRGGFKPRHRGGRHVEIDISRQVMSLIAGGEAQHTFHVSTGASSTPTVRGTFRFYSRQPGYNSVRMYYSVYFHGGYATHGYDPVPNYPASHGCVRNPIPYSRFIYNWVELGMPVYVYG